MESSVSLTPTKQHHASSTIDNSAVSPLTPRRKTPTRLRSKSTPSRKPTPLASSSTNVAPTILNESSSAAEEGILVAIRMRPLNKNESSHCRVWKALPKFTSVTQTTTEGKPLPERILHRNFFTFDKAFGEESSTDAVYTSVAKNIVVSACTGLNGTIFAYGQTSSGKTYTMQGSGTIAEGSTGMGGGGIVHMAAQDVFSHIANTPDRSFTVRASFLEIYNEEVRDLLGDSRTLQIREDPRRGVFVLAKEEIVTDFSSLLAILFQGEKSRAFASTAMNERSSRSHTIFRITIESRAVSSMDDTAMLGCAIADSDDGAMRVSTLNLVDLAGSESVRHTGATGDRQKEGGMINQSLLTLSRVMKSLGTPNQAHINFRDSKLTRILQPSLSGNARMAVICCITSSELYLEETRSTLQFAQRAKLVKTNAQVNEVLDDRTVIRRLQRDLVEARRNGSGPEVLEHIQLLERRAVLAENAAIHAKQKLHQMYESSLHPGRVDGIENGTERPLKRMRRLSEGVVTKGLATPSTTKQSTSIPATLPRETKSAACFLFNDAAPLSTEADLLRRALSVKTENMHHTTQWMNRVSKELDVHKDDLAASIALNTTLKEDRDTANEVVSRQEADIAQLKQQLIDADVAHKSDILEKGNEIMRLQASLDQQLEERKLIDRQVVEMQQENHDLGLKLTASINEKDDEIGNLQFEVKIVESFIQHFWENEVKLMSGIQDRQNTIANTEQLLQTLRDESNQENALNAKENDALSVQIKSMRAEINEASVCVDKLSKEILLVREEKNSMAQQRDTLQVKLLDASVELDALKQTLDNEIVKRNAVEEKNEDLRAQLVSSNDGLTQATANNAEKELAFDALCGVKDELHHNFKVAEAKIAALTSHAEAMRMETTILDSQLRESKENLDTRTAEAIAVNLENESNHAEVVRLGEVVKQMMSELAEVSSDKENALKRVCEMEVDLISSLTTSDELKNAGEDLNVMLQQSETEKCDLRSRFAFANDKLINMSATVNEKEVILQALSCENDEMRRTIEKDGAEVVELASQISAMRDEVVRLNAFLVDSKKVVTDNEIQYSVLKQEHESNLAEIEKLCNLVESSTDELVQVVSDKVNALHRLSGMEADLHAATEELDLVTKANDDLIMKLASTDAKRCDLGNRIAATTKELEEKNLSIAESNETIQSLHTIQDELNCIVDTTKTENNKFQAKLDEMTIKLDYTEACLESCKRELDSARQNSVAQLTLDGALAEKMQLEKFLLDASNQKAADDSTILELKEEVAELSSHTNLLKEEIGRLERKRNALEDDATNSSKEVKRIEMTLQATKESLQSEEEKYIVLATELSEVKQTEKLKNLAVSDLNIQIQTYELIVKSLTVDLEKSKTVAVCSSDSLVAAQTKLNGLLIVLGHALIQEEKLSDELKALRTNKLALELHAEHENAVLIKIKDDLAVRLQEGETERLRHNDEITAAKIERDETIKRFETMICHLEDERRVYMLERTLSVQEIESERRLSEQLIHRITDLERSTVLKSDGVTHVNLVNVDPSEKSPSEKLSDILLKLDSIAREYGFLEAKCMDGALELRNNRDELLVMHDAVNTANNHIGSLQQQLNDLADELNSKDVILGTIEQERKQLLSSLEDLRRQLGTTAHKEHESNVDIENTELKLLLASANRSIENARGQAELAEIHFGEMNKMLDDSKNRIADLEASNDEMSKNSITRTSSHSFEELNAILNEKRDLERLLQEERKRWERAMSEMKLQMSNNERELIRDAEKSMRELRIDLASKQQLTKCLEAEAYEARRMNEILEDKLKRVQDRISQEEERTGNLERENAALKRSSKRVDSEKDSEISSLKATLQQTKSSQQNVQATLRDIETSLIATIEAKEAVELRLAALNVGGLENENRRLTNELNAVGLEALELKQTIQSHEARIEKLKSNRLTKTQLAAIQQLKSDNAAFIEEVKKLKSDNESLIAKWSESMKVGDPSKMENSDLTRLRFDNEAMEKKLRKFAAHCQSLEDDRVRILRVLQNSKCVSEVDENDIEKAIVKICDVLSSLKRDRCTVMDIENRAALEVSELKTQITRLNRQIFELRDSSSKTLRSDEEHRAQIELLKSKLQNQQGFAARTRELEAENVELHDDLKSAKHQVYGLKAEITRLKADTNLLRDELAINLELRKSAVSQVKGTPHERPPIGPTKTDEKARRFGGDSKSTPRKGGESSTKLTPKRDCDSKTPKNKENTPDNTTGMPQRHHSSSTRGGLPHNLSASRATRQAARLGEAYAASEENTQQCQQS